METLDIEQTAAYLSRDVREVGKLRVSRGHIPGRKVNGEWRFIRSEVSYWIESRLHEYDEPGLRALEWRTPSRSASRCWRICSSKN